jgi:hypothetical protein
MLKNRINVDVAFVLNSILLVALFNQIPLKRFPNWDLAWGDSMQVSRIFDLQVAIRKFEIPDFNYFSGLGIEKISEQSMYENPINPLNLILLFPINPTQFIVLKTILFLSILQIGTFRLIKKQTGNSTLGVLSAISITSLPVFWSMLYARPGFHLICSVPMIIFLFEKYFETKKPTYVCFYSIIIFCAGIDTFNLINIGLILLGLGVASLLNEVKLKRIKQIKTVGLFSAITGILSLGFVIPYIAYLLRYDASLNQLGISKNSNITPVQYIDFLIKNGAHTAIYPIEGSGIQLYLPITISLTVALGLLQRNIRRTMDQTTRNLLVITASVIIVPVSLYVFPFTSKFMTSYLRSNLYLLPILIYLVFILMILNFRRKQAIGVIIFGVFLEIVFFLINPFSIIDSLKPALIVLNTHKPILDTNLDSPLKWDMPFIYDYAWLNLIIANLLLVLCTILLASATTKKNAEWKRVILLAGICISIYSFSSHVELKRFMNDWQQTSSSEYRFQNYDQRINKWMNTYGINDANYRILLVGKEFYKNSGRNIKLVLDSEMNNMKKLSVLPQYRESDNPLMGIEILSYKCKDCGFAQGESLSANHPLLAQDVIRNYDWLQRNSVKYIISADEEIESINLKFLDKYSYPKNLSGYDETENGEVFLYEYVYPRGIIQSSGSVLIKNLTVNQNGIKFSYSSNSSETIRVNYLYSENFTLEINSKRAAIYRSADNRLEFKSMKGLSNIEIYYRDSSYRWGLIAVIILYSTLLICLTRRMKNTK